MITNYPDKNSLKEVFSSELSITALKNLCQENGIFLLSSNKEDVIKTAHLFYWGFSDINRVSEQMEDSKNYKKSFRLAIDPAEDYSSDDGIFKEYLSLITKYRTSVASISGIKFETFTIDNSVPSTPHIKAIVEYEKRRKGRVKLLDKIPQRFSMDIFEEDNKIIVDVIFDERNNVQMAKKIIDDTLAITSNFKAPKQITLNSLTIAERVELYDRFLSRRFANWKIEAVKNIKVQMPDGFEIDDEDGEEERVENNFLAGIESALFSGTGLRTNPIVVDAVSKGYFFPKASIMLEHKREAIKMLLEVSFNTDDLVLELSVISTFEIEDGKEYKHPMLIEEQKSELQYFHGVLNTIYSELIQERENN